jgi:hypothetical protein
MLVEEEDDDVMTAAKFIYLIKVNHADPGYHTV